MHPTLDKWLTILCGPYARWRQWQREQAVRDHHNQIIARIQEANDRLKQLQQQRYAQLPFIPSL